MIAADTQAVAQRAAKKVKIVYQELDPVIITIEDAIKHKSYLKMFHGDLVKGDIDKVMKEAPHVVEGVCRMGGQEHFYLETQACVVIPKPEDGEMEILSSTQNVTELSVIVI